MSYLYTRQLEKKTIKRTKKNFINSEVYVLYESLCRHACFIGLPSDPQMEQQMNETGS